MRRRMSWWLKLPILSGQKSPDLSTLQFHDGIRPPKEGAHFNDAEFQAILIDYESAREDARLLEQVRSQVFALALGSLTVVTAFFPFECLRDAACRRAPDYVLAAFPVIPLALFAYLTVVGGKFVLASFYLRDLERQLRSATQFQGSSLLWAEIEVETNRANGKNSIFDVMLLLMVVGAIIIFGGLVGSILWIVSGPWKLIMILAYGVSAGLIFRRASDIFMDGREIYLRVRKDALEAVQSPLEIKNGEFISLNRESRASALRWRRMLFHLLPRRSMNFLGKWGFYLLGALYPIILAGISPAGVKISFLTFCLCLIFDLLLYQARYMANDIWGYEQDRQHLHSATRNRLGNIYRDDFLRAVRSAITNILARVILFSILFILAPSPLKVYFGWAAILLLAISLPYDKLRRRASGSYIQVIFVYLLAAAGYPLRVGLGLSVAANLGGVYVAALTKWHLLLLTFLFGLMFLGLAWTVEAVAQVNDQDITATSRGPRGLQRSDSTQLAVLPQLLSKPHQLLQLGIIPRIEVLERHAECKGEYAHYLRNGDRWPALGRAPATIATYAIAASTPWVLLAVPLGDVVPFLMIGLLAGIVAAYASPIRSGFYAVVCVAWIGIEVFTGEVIPTSEAAVPAFAIASFLWLGVVGLNTVFRRQSFNEQMQSWLPVIYESAKRLFGWSLRFFFGVNAASRQAV